MKPAASYIIGAVLGAALLWLGTHFGVWYERYHSDYWKAATMECIEQWVEYETVCGEEGVEF